MRGLDIPTLVLVSVFTSFIVALALALTSLNLHGRNRAAAFWSAGFFLKAVGFLGIFLRGTVPEILSQPIANTLVFSGTVLLFVGVHAFLGRRLPALKAAAWIAACLLLLGCLWYLQSPYDARVLCISLMHLAVDLLIVARLLARMDRRARAQRVVASSFVLLDAALHLARAALAVLLQPQGLFAAPAVSAVGFVEAFTMPVGLGISLLAMVARENQATREQAAREFEMSESRLRAVLDNTKDAIGVHVDGIWKMCNPAAVRLFGVPSADSLIGTPILDVIAPRERDRIKGFVNSRADGADAPADYLTCGLRADGTEFVMDVEPSSFHLHGQLHVLVILRDVTGRLEAENAIKESEEKFRALFEQATDGILVVDLDTADGPVVTDANQSACRATGYARDELVGMPVIELNTPENRPRVAEWAKSLLEGGQVTFETSRRRKDGTVYRVEASGRQVRRAGKPPLYFIIERDITERTEALKKLAMSEERFRRLFEDSPIAIAFLGPQRQITLTNRRFRDFVGLGEAEILARGPAGILHPDDVEPSVAMSLKLRSGEIPVFHMEQRFIRGDGALVWADTHIVAVRDRDGRVIHTISWSQDITERKTSEEVTARLQGQLAQARKMESVGRLAGGVAHDFNNLLQVICGYAEVAQEALASGTRPFEELQQISDAAERSASLTRQLLAFARKQDVVPRVLDLNQTVHSMVKMLQRLIGEDIELIWHAGPALWPVKVDPAQVDQVLANLAANARDAIAGVGSVTISTSNVAIDDAWCAAHLGWTDGDFVKLSVRDTGKGMSRETLENIFEPFFTTKGLGHGTGLGLATVYGIVKQNSGFVDVRSDPGAGTTFDIYLPRTAEAVTVRHAKLQDAAPTGTETVLVVEDDEAILRLVRGILERLGYSVLLARTPGTALELVERYAGPLQLLLTDVVMPELNGRELRERLAVHRPGVRALFMSGYTADVISRRGLVEEGTHFIQKPFSMHALAVKVREVLDSQDTPRPGS